MKQSLASLKLSLKIALFTASLLVSTLPALSVNTVGEPNILWRNPKSSGTNRVWLMNGANYLSTVGLPSTGNDHENWKMVGTGDLNGDGTQDIVWQNLSTRTNAVWVMQSNSFNVVSTNLLPMASGSDPWMIVGVADFNRDGISDILLQRADNNLNAVWLMKSDFTILRGVQIVSNSDPDWRIVGTGDINGDQHPDILLRHRTSGDNAVWLMGGTDGLQFQGGQYLPHHGDQDYRIVASWDFDNNGKTDIFLRHATLGLSALWSLSWSNNGITLLYGTYPQPEYNADWKIATQDMADSTWQLQGREELPTISAMPSLLPLQINLNFKFPYIVSNASGTVTIQRKKTTDSQWTTLTSGQLPLDTTNYTDTSVQVGERYEYRIFRVGTYVPSRRLDIVSSVSGNPIENRGRVILLVDQTLASQLTTNLAQLESDLVGDGWTVESYTAPRHVDDYSDIRVSQTNSANAQSMRTLIASRYSQNPSINVVFIIGHVAIPYSGYYPADGHCSTNRPDHFGAWVADIFYGDVNGTWTDISTNYVNLDFSEPHNFQADGKFDHDKIPEPGMLQLAVGRVDFARLPVFYTNPPPGRSEVQLIKDYLDKNHRYRFKQLSWQSSVLDRSICFNHFDTATVLENNAIQNTRNLLGDGKLIVGDFFFQRTRAYPIGYLAGSGYIDRINWDIYPIEHTSAHLVNLTNEPTCGFYLVCGSYCGDWNLGQNNFLRSLLTTPNYGLAAMWTPAIFVFWRFDCLAIGEHLGMALQRRVSNRRNLSDWDKSGELTILGDPTLRLHTLLPPSGVVATLSSPNVNVIWQSGEPGAQYHVYRSSSTNGPFARVTTSPVSGTSVQVQDDASKRIYMVRAVKLQSAGCGSYTNLSQGAADTAQ